MNVDYKMALLMNYWPVNFHQKKELENYVQKQKKSYQKNKMFSQ